MHKEFGIPVLNAPWRITTSEKLGYGDQKLQYILDLVDDFFKNARKPLNMVLISYPVLMKCASQVGLSKAWNTVTSLMQLSSDIR